MGINNGLLWQWGFRRALVDDEWIRINLPISYTNTGYKIFECSGRTTASGVAASNCGYQYNTKTTTSFGLIQDTYTDNGGNWLTLGY